MVKDIQNLLDRYAAWLKDKTVLRQINNQWVEITTPYLDRHNDYLQIYAKQENGGYILTDDGEIIKDLNLSGCKLDSPKRQDLLRMTLNGFGVRLDNSNSALVIRASLDDFPLRKHSLIQAMLSVNDLFYLAEPMVASLFLEDVTAWLDSNEIRYTPRVKFTGQSGYDHVFDFVIPKSKKQPERILRAISKPDRTYAQAMIQAWFDTRNIRPADSKAYAFLNDSERPVQPSVKDALQNYDVRPIIWSERENVKLEIAA